MLKPKGISLWDFPSLDGCARRYHLCRHVWSDETHR